MSEVRVDGQRKDLTLVLVGRTGNGKSATGNSIITVLNSMAGRTTPGRQEQPFFSKRHSSGVTKTCETQTAEFQGRRITLIDTPGLFDMSMGLEEVAEELVRCLTLAKDGIDAVLLVFTLGSRITLEEKHTLNTIRCVFGSHIMKHVILVFTNGNILDEDNTTLEEYLQGCDKFLKDLLSVCNNRKMVIENKPKHDDYREVKKRENQVKELLKLVEDAVDTNGGVPYTDELHQIIQKRDDALKGELEKIKREGSQSNRSRKELVEISEKAMDKYRQQIKLDVYTRLMQSRKSRDEERERQEQERMRMRRKMKEESEKFMKDLKKMREDSAKQRQNDKIATQRMLLRVRAENDALRKALVEYERRKQRWSCSVL